jgi:hypothetical protein
MKDPLVVFWMVLVVSSILWYGFLVFYIGIKAGRELLAMIKVLKVQAPLSQ